jgi:putative Mg2+ transporter-C (MgtC) family protein
MFPLDIATLVKLTISVLLGSSIGIEREIASKPAGFRTNVLICFGSALFTILSVRMSVIYGGAHIVDPTRIAAQIVTGIGFIGAGTVLRSQGSVHGLTSAATIWAVSAIGVAIGIGEIYLAIISSIIIVVVLIIFGWFEKKLIKE